MKKGDILLNIEAIDIASNGKAIAKHEGQVIFVNGLVPGDVANVQIFKKRRKYAEGNYTSIQSYSSDRVEAKCVHFGICGGCKWQHLNYDKQLKYKQDQVAENLKKLSGVQLPEINPIIPSERLYEYRNKLEFTFSNKSWLTEEEIKSGIDFNDRNALGFHIPGRFDKVLDINECHLQAVISNDVRNFIRTYSHEHLLTYFDLREQVGLLRNLIIRTTTTGELMIILSITEWNDEIEKLMKALMVRFKEITSLNYVVNQKKNDTINDLEVICYEGKSYIEEKMRDLTFKIGPKSFYQTNGPQAEILYKITSEMACFTGNEIVYDLYTGTGTIANYIAGKAKKVIGVEYVEEAIKDAEENSKINKIQNTSFYAGDMKDIITDSFFKENGSPDVIITDPPRSGMHPDVVEKLKNSGAKIIIYVSCNPATQARDLQVLDEKYKVVNVQPVDMFPHTAHVENVLKLALR